MNVIAERYSLYLGDCLEVMKTFPDNTYDSIVTDPPYGLKFMGKNWDHGIPGVPFWAEMLRVAKPGAFLLAFGGTRTHHRLMVAIEDAGWEIRDCLMWLYGSGFPKSHNISAAIDAHLGAERIARNGINGDQGWVKSSQTKERCGICGKQYFSGSPCLCPKPDETPITDAAKLWDGYGSALKPAWEPIIVAMKPLEGTFAASALQHGVAGLWVDGCRVEGAPPSVPQPIFNSPTGKTYGFKTGEGRNGTMSQSAGRWPANLLLDQQAAALLDEQSGESKSTRAHRGASINSAMFKAPEYESTIRGHDDEGGASRFFTVLPDSEPRFCYTAKASGSEKSQGTGGLITWENAALNQEMEALHQLVRDISDDTMRQLNDHEWSTASYGNGSMERFPMGIKSIIKTASKLIIDLKTSNLLTPQHISDCTLAAIRQMMADGLNLVENAESINQWIQIITSGLVVSVPGVVPAVLKMLLQISAKGRLGNSHNTVKPLSLMRWLVRLTKTPTGGVVLDPFAGSGTTGVACLLEGRKAVLIEREPEYYTIAHHRLEHWQDEADVKPRKLRGKDKDFQDMPLFADV